MLRVNDWRATHYWDPDLRVSRALKQAHAREPFEITGKRSLVEDEIAWDLIALFPAGSQWNDALPRPAFLGGPVIQVREQALQRLR
jgi:hypothetical protein